MGASIAKKAISYESNIFIPCLRVASVQLKYASNSKKGLMVMISATLLVKRYAHHASWALGKIISKFSLIQKDMFELIASVWFTTIHRLGQLLYTHSNKFYNEGAVCTAYTKKDFQLSQMQNHKNECYTKISSSGVQYLESIFPTVH